MEIITLKQIAEMSDKEVYALSVPRPNHPLGTGEARGFQFTVGQFNSQKEMADCMYVLLKRLGKIKS